MKKQFRWINEDIDISGFYHKLDDFIKELIKDAEEADKNDNYPVYYEMCDNIDVQAKLYVPDVLSEKEWNMLCYRYTPYIKL